MLSRDTVLLAAGLLTWGIELAVWAAFARSPDPLLSGGALMMMGLGAVTLRKDEGR